jgi:hypothetical protein
MIDLAGGIKALIFVDYFLKKSLAYYLLSSGGR